MTVKWFSYILRPIPIFVVVFREREIMKVRLQEYLSACLSYHIKAKAKQATDLVQVQSVLCEEAVFLKIVILV